jgi:hypothetical protein
MYLLAICTGKVADTDEVKHTEALDAIQLGKVASGCDWNDRGPPSTPHLRVIVIKASIAAAGDGRPHDGGNGRAPSLYCYHDLTACRPDQDAAVVYTNAPVGFLVPSAGLNDAADADLDLGVACEEHIVKNPIFHYDVRRVLELQLVYCVACGAAVRAGPILINLVPCYEALFHDGGGSGLIHGDVVWERLTPAVVGHVLDIVERSTANVESLILAVVQGADIVRLAVVIP